MPPGPAPAEKPDDLHDLQVTEATFDDFLDTFVETQTEGLELEPIEPWRMPLRRKQ